MYFKIFGTKKIKPNFPTFFKPAKHQSFVVNVVIRGSIF